MCYFVVLALELAVPLKSISQNEFLLGSHVSGGLVSKDSGRSRGDSHGGHWDFFRTLKGNEKRKKGSEVKDPTLQTFGRFIFKLSSVQVLSLLPTTLLSARGSRSQPTSTPAAPAAGGALVDGDIGRGRSSLGFSHGLWVRKKA